VYQVYNPTHDSAQLLVRRLERDLHWAKDRRRQHEREIEDARRVLAMNPIVLAGMTPLVAAVSILVTVGGCWAALSGGVPERWASVVLWVAVALTVAVVTASLVSLLQVRARRAAARNVVESHEARLAHTQYHLNQAVHSYIDAHVEARNARELHLV
jgi:hypothetical protein